jgi:hypothetical protein
MRRHLFTPLSLWLALSLATGLLVLSQGVASALETKEATFAAGTAALRAGSFNEAIAHFEVLSDSGVKDQSASINRALAYLQRAESPSARAGDRGQAVAGFREALTLGADEPALHNLVEQVRHSIARERAQRGLDPVVVRPSLGRAALLLVPETVWAVGALLGSLLLTAGLAFLERKTRSAKSLAAQVLAAVGLFALLSCGALSFFTRSLRLHDQEAVVIVNEARLLDDNGAALKSRAIDLEASAIPEGASVFASEQRGRLVRVYWGQTAAWVQTEQLRFVHHGLGL